MGREQLRSGIFPSDITVDVNMASHNMLVLQEEEEQAEAEIEESEVT